MSSSRSTRASSSRSSNFSSTPTHIHDTVLRLALAIALPHLLAFPSRSSYTPSSHSSLRSMRITFLTHIPFLLSLSPQPLPFPSNIKNKHEIHPAHQSGLVHRAIFGFSTDRLDIPSHHLGRLPRWISGSQPSHLRRTQRSMLYTRTVLVPGHDT